MNYDIMNPHNDTSKYIYHYTTVETLVKYILPQKQLIFSPLFKSNDPEESRYHIHIGINDDGLLFDKLRVIGGGFVEKSISEKILSNVKTICFSQDNSAINSIDLFTGKGFAKPRMWAQYAENHTGVCLVFEKEKFLYRFEKEYSIIPHFSDNVSYGNKLNLIGDNYLSEAILSSDLGKKSIENITQEKIEKYNKIYYFYKHEDWQTENEFRLVIKSDDDKDYFINIDGLLEHIILGVRFDMNIVESLKILSSNFETKPSILPFLYNMNNYTFGRPIS